MDPLPVRLKKIVELLQESNRQIEDSRIAEETGFLSFSPERLAEAVLRLTEIAPSAAISLDLGCGNGQWALLTAAAGFPSYGIDINPDLIDEARQLHQLCVERNMIDKTVVCRFSAGNFYPQIEKEAMIRFRDQHKENPNSMPWSDDDPYSELGISLSEVDIIYTWSWPSQSRFLYNFLERSAKRGAILVLPSYVRYTQGEHMNAMMREPNRLILQPLFTDRDLFAGRKV
jgi:SAM-dependent methyltransferase